MLIKAHDLDFFLTDNFFENSKCLSFVVYC